MRDTNMQGWRNVSKAALRVLPREARPWIALTSSMTRQVHCVTSKQVRVKILRETTGRLNRDECRLLGVARASGWVREIILSAGDQPMLVARTVSIEGHTGAVRKLRALGTRPLGELLFKQGIGHWRQREFTRLSSRLPLWSLLEKAMGNASPYWTRRTVFLLHRVPVLVTEILLPTLIEYEKNRNKPEPFSNVMYLEHLKKPPVPCVPVTEETLLHEEIA